MTATLATRQGPGAAGNDAGPVPAPRRRLRRFWVGQPADPRWARPALLGLLAVTAALYLINLSASG